MEQWRPALYRLILCLLVVLGCAPAWAQTFPSPTFLNLHVNGATTLNGGTLGGSYTGGTFVGSTFTGATITGGTISGTDVGLGVVTATGSTTARTLAQRAAGCDAGGAHCTIIYAKDFGLSVVNTGAQNTTALQAVVTRACALGNTLIIVDAGSYAVDATSSVPLDESTCNFISLVGAGINSTVFVVTGNNDFIHVGGATPYYQPGMLANFTASAGGTNPTAGSGIHLETVQRMTAENLSIGGFFSNIRVSSGLNIHFLNVSATGDNTTTGSSLWLFDKSASGLNGSEIVITDTNSRAQTRGTYTYGAIVTAADGIQFNNYHLGFTSAAAIHLTPGQHDKLVGLEFVGGLLDEAGTGLDCVQPGGYDGSMGAFKFAASGVNQATNAGMTFSCAAISGVSLSGFASGISGGAGVSITAGTNFSINGGFYASNNGLNNGSPNLYVGGTAAHVMVNGLTMGAGSTTILPTNIAVADSADYVTVSPNDYSGASNSNNVVVTSTGTHNPPALGYTYTGPGDVTSGASMWWGLRGYSVANAIAGSKAINIVRASDSTTADITILPNGKLDAATATAFCASTTCKVVTAYDQTGNGHDLTQGTDANRPALTLNCLNGMPCLTFAGTQGLQNVAPPTIAQPFTISSVFERTGSFTSANNIFNINTSSAYLRGSTSANLAGIYAGGSGELTAAAADSAWHVVVAVYNSGLGINDVDDLTPATGNAGPASLSTNITWGASFALANGLNGKSVEIGVWPAGSVAANRTNRCHNSYSFWATSVAC